MWLSGSIIGLGNPEGMRGISANPRSSVIFFAPEALRPSAIYSRSPEISYH